MKEQDTVTSIGDLVAYYNSLNHDENLYVGIELERSGIFRDSLLPVPFDGEHSYLQVFNKLVEEAGWEIIERDESAIYALGRGDTQITTETDGRPELTGSPKEHLHDLAREFRLHDHELQEMGNMFNIAWLPLGLQPFSSNEIIPVVPKQRYEVFLEADNSSWTHTFLRRMNGIHMNFSYTSEKNAIAKAQTAFRILPIISAMFASSSFAVGKPTGLFNTRRNTFCTHPPLPVGLPSSFLDSSFSFEEWIAHMVSLPVILLYTPDMQPVHPKGMTFADWMEKGYEGGFPTVKNFDDHIKAIWSDIRLRPSYIEYRVADSVPSRLALSLPALIKGLVFDSDNWEAVRELTKDWTYDDVLDIDRRSWKDGLQTDIKGKPLLTYAQELITLANEKLHKFERTDAQEEDESMYLTPLKEQIFIKEKSPAEELISLYEGEWNGDLSRIIDWCEAE